MYKRYHDIAGRVIMTSTVAEREPFLPPLSVAAQTLHVTIMVRNIDITIR